MRPENTEEFSAIVLAGGKSSRMGRDKADLPFLGTSLLEYQISLLKHLGLDDIMVSGKDCSLPGVRCIPDLCPERGPLAGIASCMREARHESCLVMAVDTPLVREDTLRALLKAYAEGSEKITLLECQGHWEPLLAVYCSDLYPLAEKILETGRGSMRELIQSVPHRFLEYREDPELLMNCNTPEAYQRALALGKEMETKGKE